MRRRFASDAMFVPVLAQEAAGRNKIPLLLAAFHAQSIGADFTTEIVQSSRAFHTGARPLERVLSRARFDGAVTPTRRYVLVDDVTVMGSTLAELANHIRSGGGRVIGALLLVNAGRRGVLTPEPSLVRLVEARFGDEIREWFNIEPEALTAAEAGYLSGFRDAQSLGNSIAKARDERGRRLRAKGVRPSASED